MSQVATSSQLNLQPASDTFTITLMIKGAPASFDLKQNKADVCAVILGLLVAGESAPQIYCNKDLGREVGAPSAEGGKSRCVLDLEGATLQATRVSSGNNSHVSNAISYASLLTDPKERAIAEGLPDLVDQVSTEVVIQPAYDKTAKYISLAIQLGCFKSESASRFLVCLAPEFVRDYLSLGYSLLDDAKRTLDGLSQDETSRRIELVLPRELRCRIASELTEHYRQLGNTVDANFIARLYQAHPLPKVDYTTEKGLGIVTYTLDPVPVHRPEFLDVDFDRVFRSIEDSLDQLD
jgi:hypothetical protein